MKYPTAVSEHCFEEKRSRFITELLPANSEADIKNRISQLKNQHPKASHVCSAFRLNINDQVQEGFSDDGEPSGTAGMPMLKVIRHHQLINCAVLVTRYFGGIKLGMGGLQRAYGQACSNAIMEAQHQLSELKKTRFLTLSADFHQENSVRHLASQFNNSTIQIDYHARGLDIVISVEDDDYATIRERFIQQNFQLKSPD